MNEAIIILDSQRNEFSERIVDISYNRRIPIFWMKSDVCSDLCFEMVDTKTRVKTRMKDTTMNYIGSSAFMSNNLDKKLKEIGVYKIIIVGNTNLLNTINDAKKMGYKIQTITECLSYHNIDDIDDIYDVISIEKYESESYKITDDSRIYYNFMEMKDVVDFDVVKESVNWKTMMQKGSDVPRLISIQGEIVDGKSPLYRHPVDKQPELKEFQPLVKLIRDKISVFLGYNFNHVLVQYYRNGADNIGQHSDKTLDIIPNTPIVNYSLGATRTMQLIKKDGRDRLYIGLSNNSLFVMGLETNDKYLHMINSDNRLDSEKTENEKINGGGRISFTFRCIGTFIDKNNVLSGQGAPMNNDGKIDDSYDMMMAFSNENRNSNFDRKVYENGFWALDSTNIS